MTEARYRAFISSSGRDDQWTTWLGRALESYAPPRRLVGQATKHGAVPKRLGSVFRDRAALEAAIREALELSACQIVICSPEAARSKSVNEEVKAFKRLGREDRIFCLVVDGEPNATDLPGRQEEECFPPAVRFKLGDDGELSDERTEPIAAEARLEKDGKANAKLKLIAGMLGVGFDALKQRELRRRQVRMTAIATGSVAGLVFTSVLAFTAIVARSEAEEQRARAQAEAETAKQTATFMVDLFRVSDPSEERGNTVTAREILDKGAARIDRELATQPAIQATMMQTMGSVYTGLGLYDPAVSLLESALEKRKAVYGEQHLEVAAVLERLGTVHKHRAEDAAAEQWYRQALDVRRAQLGDENAEVANVTNQLGDVLGLMGEFSAAETLLRQALDVHRRLLGAESPAPEVGDDVAEDV